MKTIISLVSVFLFFGLTSCKSEKKNTEQEPVVVEETILEEIPASVSVDFKELNGYFVKNRYEQKGEIDLVTLVNKDQLKDDFGIAKTMTNKVDTVNFDSEFVISLISQQTDLKTDIKVDRIEMAGDVLSVHASVTHGEKQTFTSRPAILVAVSKDPGIKNVELYVNEEKKSSNNLP